jgi:hypothetical protein
MASRVIWHRRRKSSPHRVTPIEVDVVGRTPSGNVVIEYMHRYRKIRKMVKQSNLELVEDE